MIIQYRHLKNKKQAYQSISVKLKYVCNFLWENRQMKKNHHFNLFFYQDRSMQPYFIIHYNGVKISTRKSESFGVSYCKLRKRGQNH